MSVIAVLQRSPDTGLAIRQLFQTLPQRTRGNQKTSETKEFIESFKQLREVQANLRQLEHSVNRWAKASRLLSTAAVDMATTLSRLNDTSTLPTDGLVQRASTVKILVAVRKKISLVNVLLKERQLLIHLRYVRDRATSYTVSYEAKVDPDEKMKAKVEKWQERRKKAQDNYDGLYEQLLQGINFTLEESKRKGIFMIFGTELKAFAESQHILFEACEKILEPAITEANAQGGGSLAFSESEVDLRATDVEPSSKRTSRRGSGGESRGSKRRSSRSGSKSRRSSSRASKGRVSSVTSVTETAAKLSDEESLVDSDSE